ncbi:hypothetical protein Pure05_05400 [Paenarthrobacter ureafaciens]|nr:hypothetical protein NicSoilE8_25050 [Arthrobacter sp. NicSoilE8]GLU57678.1 hypothetical protein Pure01_01910 [Paenarthrobacter ureafaciens]GLU62292.1 hypothetical protein Pure02_05420 [Paenarthrobacter ureafaciens]GLU66566.1 hypothetical protein Pure03_05420 [Paenarthrobacter ureafaciens]GLU70479.1 hypothetical protein Pure04_01940 [Paenarthrobacter ureafaciens]
MMRLRNAASSTPENGGVRGSSVWGLLSLDKWNYSVAMPAPAVPNVAGFTWTLVDDTNANGSGRRRDAAGTW